LAQASGLAIDVVESFGEELPFLDDVFDVVHCRAVLHHARDLPALCAQAARVLRPGGRLIATREHVISEEADRAAFLAQHPLHRLYGGENAYRKATYLAAIVNAGLTPERVLNPFESDINLFPGTQVELKARIARRLKLPGPQFVPDAVLGLLGWWSSAPGRLYTFVARKPLE
jgi:SAM-dependent methyltransferase